MLWLRRLPGRVRSVIRDRVWPPVLTDQEVQRADAPPSAVYAELARIGGPNGWYYMDWSWRLRGALDLRLGGPGLDRLTPLPPELRPGERRDVWQVLEAEPNRRVRMRALMRLPGEAELEWTVAPREKGGSVLYQTARFRPRGAAGRLYWYALLPVHRLIFRGMARAVAQRAGRVSRRAPVSASSS